ncbi:hypothetical protein Tco_1339170, partial [Tanacetum coccineum]
MVERVIGGVMSLEQRGQRIGSTGSGSRQ